MSRLEHLEGFYSIVRNCAAAYTHMSGAYVAVKGPSGTHLFAAQIALKTTKPPRREPFRFESKHFIAGQFSNPIAEDTLEDILAKAKSGKMDSSHGELALFVDDSDFSPYWWPGEDPFATGLLFQGIGRGDNKLLDVRTKELGWELRCGDTPFHSVDDLLTYCGLPAVTGGREKTSLEVIACSPGLITSESTIREQFATIGLQVAKGLDVRNVKLGFQSISGEETIARGRVTGDRLNWNSDSDFLKCTHRLHVRGTSLVRAWLSHDGIPLSEASITDPTKRLNLRLAIHQVFDSDVAVLRQLLLAPGRQEEKEFESAVASLFGLLGFSGFYCGLPTRLQDGPDLVAATPTNRVVVVETTIGLPNNKDKLSKLTQRTHLLRTKVNENGHTNLDILPVLCTALSRKEAEADLELAKSVQVVVLCKEEMEQTLRQIELRPDADHYYDYMKQLLPPVSDELSFGYPLRRPN